MEIEKTSDEEEVGMVMEKTNYMEVTYLDYLRAGEPDPRLMHTPSPYFQVKIDECDLLFKERILMASLPPDKAYTYPQAAHEVVFVLWDHFKNYWRHFKEISVAAGNDKFYHSVIRATATVIYLAFTKDFLLSYHDDGERASSWRSQSNSLWHKLCVLGKQARPVSEVCELLFHDIIKQTDYYVTEGDVAGMVNVKIDECDLLFKEQILMASLPADKAYTYTESTHEVVFVLWNHFKNYWRHFKEISVAAGNDKFFHSVIRAAATVIYLAFTKDFLLCYYDYGERASSWRSQLNSLWDKLCVLGKQARPVSEVCELLFHDIINPTDYYVTEGDVAGMVDEYGLARGQYCCFDGPYKVFCPLLETDPIFDDLMNVVREIKPQRLKVDDYTHMLIEFAKENNLKYQRLLLAVFLQTLDLESLDELDPSLFCSFCDDDEPFSGHIDTELRIFMFQLFSLVTERIRIHLATVTTLIRPFSETITEYPSTISASVFELIEVADLRRCALGNRFINQNHFLWAFYECGYGLPGEIRNTLRPFAVNAKHPPVHVYLTAVKLAEVLEEKILRLDHFVYAVLFAEDIYFPKRQVEKMKKAFNDFTRVVASDCMKRPNPRCSSRVEDRPHIGDLLYGQSVQKLKEQFRETNEGDLVYDN